VLILRVLRILMLPHPVSASIAVNLMKRMWWHGHLLLVETLRRRRMELRAHLRRIEFLCRVWRPVTRILISHLTGVASTVLRTSASWVNWLLGIVDPLVEGGRTDFMILCWKGSIAEVLWNRGRGTLRGRK